MLKSGLVAVNPGDGLAGSEKYRGQFLPRAGFPLPEYQRQGLSMKNPDAGDGLIERLVREGIGPVRGYWRGLMLEPSSVDHRSG